MIPSYFLGPLRLAMNPRLMESILGEPLLFASHYAVVGVSIDFEGEIKDVLTRIKKKYTKHERVLQLLSSLRGQIPMELSTELPSFGYGFSAQIY